MRFNRVTFLMVLILVGSMGLAGPLVAQEAQKKQSTLHQDAESMIADLRKRAEKLRELQANIASATGERRAIYRNELFRRWDTFALRLDGLVENLGKQAGRGIEHSEQRRVAIDLTKAVGAGLSDAALVREEALAKLEDRRSEATEEERGVLTREIKRESAVYRKLLTSIIDNIERMKTLGIDSRSDGELVDGLLRRRAEILDGRIRLTLAQRNEVRDLTKSAVEADKPVLQKELNTANERLTSSSESLRSILDQMDRRGMVTTEWRELLVKSTGELGTGTFDKKVAAGLLQQWMSDTREWFRENGPSLIIKIVVILLILAAFWVLSRLTARIVTAMVQSSRIDVSMLLQDFFVMVASRAVQVIGLLVALSQLGINLAPLLAGLGIAGFVVGFALQDTLSNFASGLMILLYHPYDVTDAVEVAGVLGVVSEMNLVSTTIKTFDNQKLIVPNSKIWGDVIRNLTAEDTRRVDLVFGISYGDDIAKAERILLEEVEKHELVLAEPAPAIKVGSLGDSSVNLLVRPWVKTADYWTVYWDLTRDIKLRFDAEGISIPFPQRDVHMHNVAE